MAQRAGVRPSASPRLQTLSSPLVASEFGARHHTPRTNIIAEAIEREAAKPDNQAKLSEPVGARRRHLCVLIDSSTGATFSATSHGDMGRLPVLPPPITTAWALASTTVYSTTPPEPWQAHDAPEEVFTNPEKWVDSA
jgi:hypothetical protein